MSIPESQPQTSAISDPPNLFRLFQIWLSLGVQSFGGGAATLALIRREMVERRSWITDAQFVRDWALCQVTPGINLLGLTILIGRRLGGIPGIFVSLLGLLLPSCSVTILLTACYAHVQASHAVQAAVRGVVPATAGVGLVTAAQMARPLLAAARRDGRLTLIGGWCLLIGSGLGAAVGRWQVVAILMGAGAAGAAIQELRAASSRRMGKPSERHP
jgi:chromate transporter